MESRWEKLFKIPKWHIIAIIVGLLAEMLGMASFFSKTDMKN